LVLFKFQTAAVRTRAWNDKEKERTRDWFGRQK